MRYKWLWTILYGLLIVWVGLWRCIEARAYKPGALWFCVVMGAAAIVAGFLYRLEWRRSAAITALVTVAVVLAFYTRYFIGQPEEAATYRVGLAILASIGQIVVVLLPLPRSQIGE